MSDELRLRELCEEYALGVLEGEELALIEKRLEQRDPDVIRALADAEQLVSQLAYTAPGVDPPKRTRRALMTSVRTEAATQVQGPPSRRTWAWALVASAVAAGLLIFSIVSYRQARWLRRELASLQTHYEALTTENARYRQVLEILAAPQTLAVSLDAPEDPQLHAYWNRELGLVLTGLDVPASGAGRDWQLWAIPAAGDPVSLGVFEPDGQGRALFVTSSPLSPEETSLLAITNEAGGGAAQPTSDPIWVGPVGD